MPHFFTHLECTLCSKQYDPTRLQNLCTECQRPLYPRYDLEGIRKAVRKEDLRGRESSLWRYAEFLPVGDGVERISLGEGWTPLLPCKRLGAKLGMSNLLLKDEGQMATGSFKARGQSVAITKAKELGATSLAIPSAGNAGGAMAQYGARAGLPCYVFMPADVPMINRIECVAAGAHTYLVKGLITDCGKMVREGAAEMGWFDVSTLKEPYRVEGKKTMGLELAEQLDWQLPDVVLYPTGGGTGLVGMWKAFDELEAMGWIGSKRPRMVAVQSTGCAPIHRAFQAGEKFAEPWQNAATMASGIRVPAAVGDFLILNAIRESGGTTVTVTDEEIDAGTRLITSLEGTFVCPEGGALVSALGKLLESGWIQPEEQVVLFNTGSGTKYAECFPADLRLPVLDPGQPRSFNREAGEIR